MVDALARRARWPHGHGRGAGDRPPTSAPGYDCLGVALGLTEPDRGRGPRLEPRRDRADRRRRGRRRAARGPRRTASSAASRRRCARPAASCRTGVGWRIEMHNQIPLARGLGSSAAATVAGLVAGNALLGDAARRSAELLRLATRDRGPSRQRRGRAARRVRRSAPGSTRRRRGGPVRCPARPPGRAVHPGAAAADRRRCAAACRTRSRSPTPSRTSRRSRSASPAWPRGRSDLLARPDRRPPPRAVPRRRSTRSSRARRGRARGRRASAPACRVPARRSSPSPIRWRASPGSRPRSARPPPTRTCPAASSVVEPRAQGARVVTARLIRPTRKRCRTWARPSAAAGPRGARRRRRHGPRLDIRGTGSSRGRP